MRMRPSASRCATVAVVEIRRPSIEAALLLPVRRAYSFARAPVISMKSCSPTLGVAPVSCAQARLPTSVVSTIAMKAPVARSNATLPLRSRLPGGWAAVRVELRPRWCAAGGGCTAWQCRRDSLPLGASIPATSSHRAACGAARPFPRGRGRLAAGARGRCRSERLPFGSRRR